MGSYLTQGSQGRPLREVGIEKRSEGNEDGRKQGSGGREFQTHKACMGPEVGEQKVCSRGCKEDCVLNKSEQGWQESRLRGGGPL